jgi:serine phosphatase RsbU (regulator of sigma subunit)
LSDAITEAENLAGEQYGLERLCEIVAQNWQATAEVIRQQVIMDVHRHIGEQKSFDDITLLVLKQK